jgi:hypothetical protein
MKRQVLGAAAFAASIVALSTPAPAMIVNISGTANGEQTGGADCDQACEGALIDPVQVSFAAGTYTITDAFSPTTGLQAGALYDAWNFESGNSQAWVWHWKALLDDGSDGSTITPSTYAAHILLDVDASFTQDSFTTEAAAAAFGAQTAPSTLTFATATVVDFVVNDYYLPDNAGGVSLDVEPASASSGAVPEPAAWVMALAGFLAVGGSLRRQMAMTRATRPAG